MLYLVEDMTALLTCGKPGPKPRLAVS